MRSTAVRDKNLTPALLKPKTFIETPEQVKVNFTFQTILILALLEYETVSISFVTIIIINILVQYHCFNV